MKTAYLCLLLFVSLTDFSRSEEDLDWWQPAIVYQIYPRSFKDSNGDGVGDLNGITEKVDYLKDLGIGAVWLSPIYPSPGKDFGYDVANYTDIDPLFGTMEDFKNMTDTLEAAGIRVILDLVPNHSSNESNWFKWSQNRTEGYEDYYVWHDGVGPNHDVPNNWVSNFDGSMWQWSEARKQYYLHQFLLEQPDLNYNNPKVTAVMQDVLTFWSDHNVKGFRMDAVSSIWEDISFADEPQIETCTNASRYYCFTHDKTFEQDNLYPILGKFKERLDELKKSDNITRVMMTESYTTNWDHIGRYYEVTNFPFNFFLITNLTMNQAGADWVNIINSWYGNTTNRWASWVVGNHDQHRVPSRYGREMVDPINMIVLLLKGTAVTYNGEELGMRDSFIRPDQTKDPQGLRTGDPSRSRDPNRGPMIWDSSTNAGFTSAEYSWLPPESGYWDNNADMQRTNKRSHLTVYKRMARLRQTYIWQYGACEAQTLISPNVIGIFRSAPDNPSLMVLANFGLTEERLNLTDQRSSAPLNVYLYAVSDTFSSEYQFGQTINSANITLPPKSSIALSTLPLDYPIKFNTGYKPLSDFETL